MLGDLTELLLVAPGEVEQTPDSPLDESGAEHDRQQYHQGQAR